MYGEYNLSKMTWRGFLCAATAVAAAMIVSACQPRSQSPTLDRDEAIITAQQLHDELDRLEIDGQVDAQMKFYAEDVVRLDPNRAPTKGRDAFASYARDARASGYQPLAATTTVLDAWVSDGYLVEYGTAMLQVSFRGAATVDDPVNYLAVWRIDPAQPMNAQIQAIIWNTQKPVPALSTVSVSNP